jgi:hypothetical protein
MFVSIETRIAEGICHPEATDEGGRHREMLVDAALLDMVQIMLVRNCQNTQNLAGN